MAGFTYWFKYQNETKRTLIKKLGQYGLISIKCRLIYKSALKYNVQLIITELDMK